MGTGAGVPGWSPGRPPSRCREPRAGRWLERTERGRVILFYYFFIGQVLTARAALPVEPAPEPGRIPEPGPEEPRSRPTGRTSERPEGTRRSRHARETGCGIMTYQMIDDALGEAARAIWAVARLRGQC
ncbi:hypothetical protein GCM10023196_093050 [Actinoallomurus vinaceus]|uniref:Uncharacterized protein n=1 Tax=Actinoallomurus vinaceus TaxID=1080074 RepID=A0ABP8URK8_9ACTN